MVKGRKGWWRQIQSGEYADTQKKYGDSKWIEHSIKKSEPVKENIQNKPISLQNECPSCGKLYWVDKDKCFNCGWPDRLKHKLEGINENGYLNDKVSYDITPKPRPICPRCGNKMVLRMREKGIHKGKKFWVCSNYQNCKTIADYMFFLRR